jgi:hypothetical protein
VFPVQGGNVMKKLKLLIILLALCELSYAGNVCSMVPGGQLDQFLQNFYNIANNFTVNILPRIQKYYWMIWALWGCYELAIERIAGMKIDRLLQWWFLRLIVAQIIYHIFLTPNFYIGIIKLGANFASIMGGFNIDATSSTLLGNFTPSAIMGINNCVATAVDNAGKTLGTFEVLRPLELIILQYSFFAITAVAAFYVLYISIKLWLCVFAGFVNTMFAGSRWTIGWWQAYLTSVMSYALELMFTGALFGGVYQMLNNIVGQLSGANADILSNYSVYLLGVAVCGILTALMFVIPKELASRLGAGFTSTISDIAGDIKRSAAYIASSNNGGGSNSNNSTQSSQGGGTNPSQGGSGTQTKSASAATTKPSSWAGDTAKAATKVATGRTWEAAADQIKKGANKP